MVYRPSCSTRPTIVGARLLIRAQCGAGCGSKAALIHCSSIAPRSASGLRTAPRALVRTSEERPPPFRPLRAFFAPKRPRDRIRSHGALPASSDDFPAKPRSFSLQPPLSLYSSAASTEWCCEGPLARNSFSPSLEFRTPASKALCHLAVTRRRSKLSIRVVMRANSRQPGCLFIASALGLTEVHLSRQSGPNLLNLSSSGFDPQWTLGPALACDLAFIPLSCPN